MTSEERAVCEKDEEEDASILPPPRKSSIEILQQSWKKFASVPSSLEGKDPLQWTVEDVVQWLICLGFTGAHCLHFREQEIDGGSLFDIEEEDLLSSGLLTALGPRRKFLRARNCLSCAYAIEPKPLPFLKYITEQREMKKEAKEVKEKELEDKKEAKKVQERELEEMKIFRKILLRSGKIFIDDDSDENDYYDDDNYSDYKSDLGKNIEKDVLTNVKAPNSGEKPLSNEKIETSNQNKKKPKPRRKRRSKDLSEGNIAEFQKPFFMKMAKSGAGLFIIFELAVNKIFPFSFFAYSVPAFFQLAAFLPGMIGFYGGANKVTKM